MRRPTSSTTVVGGLVVVLCIPLAAAVGAVRHPRWYPLYDMAMTEMRVRDVGFSHPPLVGLPGRLSGYGLQGSHPGPVSFYALAPVYRLVGSTAWSLYLGVAVLQAVALTVALVIAYRRGGRVACLGLALALAFLMRALGPDIVTEPWNPYMPVLWWIVFVLAVWSVLCDDLPFLPVAAFAGTFCAQTHISYVVLVAVLGGLACAGVALRAWRRRANPAELWRAGRWGLLAAGLALLLWAPAIAEQLMHGTGNISIIVENFRHSTTEPLGLREGSELWFSRLDLWGMVTGTPRTGAGATGRALVLLLAWGASVGVAWERRDVPLLRLHLVLATALGVGLASLTRIVGVPWPYLHLWGWGTTVLLVVATVWTAVHAAEESRIAIPEGLPRVGMAVLGAGLVVVAASFTYDSAHLTTPAENLTRTMRGLTPEAVQALTTEGAPGGGPAGHYVVRWIDPVGIGDQGWTLLSELERAGLDANVEPALATGARDHRVLRAEEATGVVTLVVGPEIDEFRRRPGVVEVAYFEPRTASEQARFDELGTLVEEELQAAGLGDMSLFVAGQQADLSAEAQEALVELQELGLPAAVFVEPMS